MQSTCNLRLNNSSIYNYDTSLSLCLEDGTPESLCRYNSTRDGEISKYYSETTGISSLNSMALQPFFGNKGMNKMTASKGAFGESSLDIDSRKTRL